MPLPAWLRPIRDRTVRAARQALRSAAPRTPTLEEFVSPLRDSLKAELAVKPDIGYAEHCAACRAHQTVDARIAHAVAAYEDPEPWLVNLHGELVATREELTATQRALVAARKDADAWKNPLNRIRWLSAGGAVGIVFLVAKELIQTYLLPLLIP